MTLTEQQRKLLKQLTAQPEGQEFKCQFKVDGGPALYLGGSVEPGVRVERSDFDDLAAKGLIELLPHDRPNIRAGKLTSKGRMAAEF